MKKLLRAFGVCLLCAGLLVAMGLAATAADDDYDQRHHAYWLSVYTLLNELPNNGSLTVDTAGENLAHIEHFVFDALVGTNRTLLVRHGGQSYRFNGANLNHVTLGQNHLFVGNLDGYAEIVPPPNPPPATAPAQPVEDYEQRHYAYWLNAHAQLSALPDNGTLTVDTRGNNLDHIQYFVFDALNGSNRTLVVYHEGAVYRINGANLGGIALGQNHLFVGNLNGYKTN